MELADVQTTRLAYYLSENGGDSTVVIETALGSCSAEWWHIAESLREKTNVLVYDRAGYGRSSSSSLPRTPRNISKELHSLLVQMNINNNVLIVGHSQGGLYAQQFARDYPEMVSGLVLIDPLSADDNSFSRLLTEQEYKQSGVDKSKSLKVGELLCRMGLGRLLKPLIKKAPPFYYYKDFSEEAMKYMLSSLTKASHYRTALNEYNLSHSEAEIAHLRDKTEFPQIPITLITHSSQVSVDEIIYYGGTTRQVAEKIEQIWQDLMGEYLSLSSNSKWVQAEKSSHFVHLTELELVKKAVIELLK